MAEQARKLLTIYKDIKYIKQVLDFDYDHDAPQHEILQLVNASITSAREQGLPISTYITPWDFYIWTRDEEGGWYALVDKR